MRASSNAIRRLPPTATDELWVDDLTGKLGLDRKAVIRVLLMVSLGTVDIPSQMDGITDEYVAKAKDLYHRQIERRGK